MKELKFTPENLAKHLGSEVNQKSHRKVILTVRDECKGKYGDLFHIDGLENPFVLEYVADYDDLDEFYREFCEIHERETGFSPQELLEEVKRIYPDTTNLCAHWLYECFNV